MPRDLSEEQRMFLARLRRMAWLYKSVRRLLDANGERGLNIALAGTYDDCCLLGVRSDALSILNEYGIDPTRRPA